MNIDDVVTRLQNLRQQYGNVPVVIPHGARTCVRVQEIGHSRGVQDVDHDGNLDETFTFNMEGQIIILIE